MATMNTTWPGETLGSPSSDASSSDVKSIGEIIRDLRNLTPEQVEEVLAYQREHEVRFGEAAIALGLASTDDVLHALAQQFNYAYGGTTQANLLSELVVLNQPFSRQAEAIRAIRAQILLRSKSREIEGSPWAKRALAVVSPNSGDGKTYFSANLGVSLAQLGGRTLVIDADLRGPRLHEVFGVEQGVGLSGLLSGRRGDGVIKSVAGVPNLFVLPVGIRPPNPLELLQQPAFGLLLRELLNRFEHVVVDTPAALHGADSQVVAARCGFALIVARKDHSEVKRIQALMQDLSATGATMAGVVMNEI